MASEAEGQRRTYELIPRGADLSRVRGHLLASCGGQLVGAIVEGAICTWLAQTNGELVLMMWPINFRATFDPLELLDEQGNVVAVGGEFITAGGGFIRPDDPRSMGHERVFAASTAQRGDQRR